MGQRLLVALTWSHIPRHSPCRLRAGVCCRLKVTGTGSLTARGPAPLNRTGATKGRSQVGLAGGRLLPRGGLLASFAGAGGSPRPSRSRACSAAANTASSTKPLRATTRPLSWRSATTAISRWSTKTSGNGCDWLKLLRWVGAALNHARTCSAISARLCGVRRVCCSTARASQPRKDLGESGSVSRSAMYADRARSHTAGFQ